MKIIVDMNLPPSWTRFLEEAGHEALHWSEVGDPAAKDSRIMQWAREHGYVVFTHDLDFSALLAATQAEAPSVIQVRTQDVLPHAIGKTIAGVLRQFELELEEGALASVNLEQARVRLLPFGGG